MSLWRFWWWCCYSCFVLFACGCPGFLELFVEKMTFAALNCLCSFIKDQFTMFMWTYFWALYSLSLIYLFILLKILPCLLKMEKVMAPHSSTLAWKIPWIEEPGTLQSMGLQRVGHDWATSLSCIGEGNGNPFQCSCLENPRDGAPGRLPSMGSTEVT